MSASAPEMVAVLMSDLVGSTAMADRAALAAFSVGNRWSSS